MKFSELKKSVSERLKTGEYGDAVTCLAMASDERSDDWRVDLLRAEIELARNDFSAVRECIRRAGQKNASKLRVSNVQLNLAHRSGDPELEEQALRQIFEVGGMRPSLWPRLIRVVFSTGSVSFQCEVILAAMSDSALREKQKRNLWGEVARQAPDKVIQVLTALPASLRDTADGHEVRFAALMRLQRFDDAFAALITARELAPDQTLSQSLMKYLEKLEIDWSGFQSDLERLISTDPAAMELVWVYVWIAGLNGDFDKALQIAGKYSDRLRQSRTPSYIDTQFEYSLVSQSETDTPSRNLPARLLLQNAFTEGRFEDAIQLTSDEQMRALLKEAVALGHHRPADLREPSLHEEITVSGRDRPNGVVIAFAGLKDTLAMPVAVIDLFMQELGLTTIYCKDFQRLLYLNGLKTMAGDFSSTLLAMKNLVSEVAPGKPLYTFGNSAGGLAAMIYGAKLGAKSSLVFSPLSTTCTDEQEAMGDYRGRLILRRFKLDRYADGLSLSESLDEAGPDFAVTAYCPKDPCLDQMHGERLMSYPQIDVRQIEGFSGHTSLKEIASRNGFLPTLKEAYGFE